MAITMSVNEQWAVFHPCTGMETGKRTAPSHMKKNGFDFISKRLKIFRRKRKFFLQIKESCSTIFHAVTLAYDEAADGR